LASTSGPARSCGRVVGIWGFKISRFPCFRLRVLKGLGEHVQARALLRPGAWGLGGRIYRAGRHMWVGVGHAPRAFRAGRAGGRAGWAGGREGWARWDGGAGRSKSGQEETAWRLVEG
jgi:hypothetical protein